MKWLRLILLALVALVAVSVLAVALVLGPLRARTTALLRREIETLVAAAIEAPVSIGALEVSLLPPSAHADALAIGAGGALARVARIDGTLDVAATLHERRLVARATVEDVSADLPAWAALPPRAPSPPSRAPPFRVAVHVDRTAVQLAGLPDPMAAAVAAVDGELESDAVGRLAIDATASTVALTHGDETLTLDRARAALAETSGGWHLRAIEADGDGIRVTSGEPRAPETLPVRAAIDLARLGWASDALDDLGGRVEIDAALAGALDAASVRADLHATAVTFRGEPVGDVTATVALDPDRVVVDALHVDGVAGIIDGRADLGLRGARPYHGALTWSRVDVRRLAAVGEGVLKSVEADGEIALSGTVTPLTATGHGGGSIRPVAAGPPIEWDGTADYRGGGGTGTIAMTQAGANRVTARLAIAADRVLDGDVRVAIADPAALGAVLPVENLSNLRGALDATATIGGRADDPHVSAELVGHDILLLGAAIDRVRAHGSADRTAVRVAAVHADLEPGALDASGTIALDRSTTNTFDVHASGIRGDTIVTIVYAATGTVAPIGRGVLNAELHGRGPWATVQIDATASMEQFWLTREWIQSASVRATAQWPQWSLNGALRNRADQTLTLEATGNAVRDVTIEAHCPAWQLTALERGAGTENRGTVALDVALRGPPRALTGQVDLRALDLVLGGREIGAMTATATAARGVWNARAAALDGTVQLDATIRPDPGFPFTVSGGWQAARLGHLIRPGADVQIVSSGSVQVAGRLADLARAQVTAAVEQLRAASGGNALELTTPAHLACAAGVCTLDGLQLGGMGTQLRIAGTVASSGNGRVTVTGAGDVHILELIGPPIQSAAGRFAVDVQLLRTTGTWVIGGQIAADDLGLDVGAPIAITRGTARMTLAGSVLRIDRFDGRMGTGAFTVGGAIDLVRGPALTWTLRDVGADLAPSLEAEFAGNGAVEGAWDRLRITAEVHVNRMLYDHDIELTAFLPSFNRALAAAPREPSDHPITLDIHIVAPGELYVENNVARIEARADLRITGTADHPVLRGRVEGLDGEITFQDRVFELESATIDFRPELGLVAALNITAESTIDTPDATYVVAVRVTGTTADPRVALSSDDPSLSQTDLATLIAVGKTTAQLREGGGGGVSMYSALSIGAQQLTQPVTSRAQRLLPIDRITFEPTFSRTTGTFEPQLKLGKDLTDNLAVAVGQTFGVESRTTAEADYRLSPRVFVPVTWESQTQTQEGAFQAGVKLRYEFWRLTPYTLLSTLR
jgi:autotransporter translocation and assembly factor TamB